MTEREQVIANLLFMKKDCLEGSDNDKTIDRAVKLLKVQETAVPLDKLCKWLEDNASLPYGTSVSRHAWRQMITSDLMEENK